MKVYQKRFTVIVRPLRPGVFARDIPNIGCGFAAPVSLWLNLFPLVAA